MDELEGCITELLEQFPGYRILAVVATPERRRQIQARFGETLHAVTPGAPLRGERYDAVVSEWKPSGAFETWAMASLATRLAPGGLVYHLPTAA